MAEKKYLDLTGLGQYDAKIKTLIDSKDAATLASAKSYADSLAVNYDAAGTAATAKSEAIAYVDGKVTDLNSTIAGVKTIAEKGVADAATAQSAADAAQGDVDALETLVGTLPADAGVTSVVAYINKKTEGVATDAALAELQGKVAQAETDIDNIEKDYLKATDKADLEGKIATAKSEASDDAVDRVLGYLAEEEVNTNFDTLKEVAAWIESDTTASAQLVTRVTTAEGKITALETADGEQDAKIAALEAKFGEGEGSVADLIADAVAAEATLRQQGDAAVEGKAATAQAAAEAAQSAADAAQGEVDALEGVVETLTQTVNSKAAQTDLEALAGKVTTAEGKITTLEGKAHTHDNKTVLDGITAALVADWNDAVTKEHEHSNKDVLDGITSALVANWNAAEGNAKAYTDEKIGEFVAITTGEVDALFA